MCSRYVYRSCCLAILTLLGQVGFDGRCACRADSPPPAGGAGEFVSIFDGERLVGWHAEPAGTAADWSVQDGLIVGRGSADRLSYLVWQDELTDFELRLEYRLLTDGNTGIEIRAQPDASGKRPFEGYHADLGHVGIGPQILGAWDFHFATRHEPPCPRGTRLVIGPQGQLRSSLLDDAVTAQDIRRRDWNRVRIVAQGTDFRFYINGKPAAAFRDDSRQGRLDRGRIGLQLHDRGMRVQFRNLRLKQLTGHTE